MFHVNLSWKFSFLWKFLSLKFLKTWYRNHPFFEKLKKVEKVVLSFQKSQKSRAFLKKKPKKLKKSSIFWKKSKNSHFSLQNRKTQTSPTFLKKVEKSRIFWKKVEIRIHSLFSQIKIKKACIKQFLLKINFLKIIRSVSTLAHIKLVLMGIIFTFILLFCLYS